MTDPVAPAIMLTSIGLLAAAGLHDSMTRTIPNWIPASLVVTGTILRLRQGNAIQGLCVAALLLTILGMLWLRGFVGGGDMKLIPAVSLALPPSDVPNLILYVAIAGGVLALMYLALSFLVRRPDPGPRDRFFARVIKAEAWRMHRRGSLPYAVAIAAGALPIFINTFSR
jgi:prepilin peptidase CpaA